MGTRHIDEVVSVPKFKQKDWTLKYLRRFYKITLSKYTIILRYANQPLLTNLRVRSRKKLGHPAHRPLSPSGPFLPPTIIHPPRAALEKNSSKNRQDFFNSTQFF